MMETTGTATAGGGAREREGEDGLGLGLVVQQKLARIETFPFRVPSIVGPTLCNGSDSYDVGGVAATAAAAAAAAAAAGEARSLQPFAFKSPGVRGMTAPSLRFPFTWAQWQELQRQALIYKHMVFSVPVPPDLLIASNYRGGTTFSDAAAAAAAHQSLVRGAGSGFNLRFSSNSSDPEPGRCRRTDGKKWRCSRDVAPDQKYCERHMHRGRPRSRKPVEVQTQNTTRPLAAATSAPATAATSVTSHIANLTTAFTTTTAASASYHHPLGLFGKPDMSHPFQTIASASAEGKESRYLDQMESDQQWQLVHSKVGLRPDCTVSSNEPVLQPFDDHLNLNFTDFSDGGSEAQQSDQCCLYLNTDLSSLEEPGPDQRQPPRRFIDAWSVTARDDPNHNDSGKSPASHGGKLPISSLTLSMSGGDGAAAEDMDRIQMGLSISESERDNGSVKSQPLSWMNSVPWLSSPLLGGPLGEVLQSSTVAGSNSASPHGYRRSRSSCGGLNLMSDASGEAASPYDRPQRPDSSPTGVLQRTLASLSDSSSNSSPTFAAAKSEIAPQWLSQSKPSSS